ncbi:MAG: PAS domain-containing protein [Actinobacteria bacterium]|nr:PAS domain-containing protein [Actinomycetota bacterium]MCG2800844.1 PAS domain-containing protein [Cellulomonas sp.]
MPLTRPAPTGATRTFGAEEIIVSKTDSRGHITYANDVFVRVSGYTEAELLGAPHSVLRHPAMPRAVFSYLWETIAAGREVFAYVLNLASDGSSYWVLAHVTASYDGAGRIVGYHSNRRWPSPAAIAAVEPLYARLREAESRETTARAQVAAGRAELAAALDELGIGYDELVWGVINSAERAA